MDTSETSRRGPYWKVHAVYQILNLENGKRYVGSAINLAARWKNHRSDLGLGKHRNPKLQRAWNKYGEAAFSFSILELVPDAQDLVSREQYYLDHLRAADRELGYNICPTAGSNLGRKASASTRALLREIHSTRTWMTPEKKKRMSKNLSLALKGVRKSPEHAARISVGKRRLRDDQILEAHRNYEEGESISIIGARYGMARQSIIQNFHRLGLRVKLGGF